MPPVVASAHSAHGHGVIGGRFGLRTRATIAFGLIGLFVAVGLALSTYFVTRAYLIEQRQDSAERQAFANARLTRSALQSSGVDVTSLLTTLGGAAGSDVVVGYQGEWYASSVSVGEDSLPTDLHSLVEGGGAGREFARRRGGLELVVGTPMAAVDATYYELFTLSELENTLALFRNTLVAGTLLLSLAAAGLGRYAAGSVLRPLAPVTRAAQRIAGGDLQTRLVGRDDRDLAPLTDSFNSMAEALQDRLDQEARFASDVSHELRTPLAALRAAVEIIDRRRDALPDGVDAAVDILRVRVDSFEALVLDLLEISRFDANAVTLEAERLDVAVFTEQVLALHEVTGAHVHIEPAAPTHFFGDRRRLAQAFGNIIRNAERYAGGITEVTVMGEGADVYFLLDDNGPGIEPNERQAITQRFARGEQGKRAGSESGTGLGLALTVAHIALHGGDLTITDAPSGGARFVLRLPCEAAT